MDQRLSDTDAAAARLQLDLIRRAGRARRIRLALSLSDSVIDLACAGIRRRAPSLSRAEARLEFVSTHYGADTARAVRALLLGRSSS